MFLNHDHLTDLYNFADMAWKVVVKSFPVIITACVISTVKIMIYQPRMTWAQSFWLFVISFTIGATMALITHDNPNSFIYTIIATLIGDRVMRYIIIRFNDANINKTMGSFWDKIFKVKE